MTIGKEEHMNELSILATQDKKTVTTKELAQTLGVDVRTVNETVERLLDSTFQKLGDIKTVSTGGRPTKVFTEEQATAIKQEIARHHNLKSREIDSVSTELEENEIVANAIAILQRRSEEYKHRAEVAEQKLIEQSPKVEFYNDVTGSKDTLDMSQTARLINIRGMGRNKIFECLREKGILDRNNQPYQKYIDTGYFRIIESKYTTPQGDVRINLKTVVFQKGVEFIKKTLEESIKENETMEAV
jgi:phage antirepressor YoqD-like protein/predicted transcriptional regulator